MRTEPSFSSEPSDVDDDQPHFKLPDDNSSESQLLSDYRQRYGLSVDPFSDDPHFPLYTGAQRRHVLEQLLHLSQFSNNLLVVLGDYGVGKTRMAQALIDSLDDADDICFLEGQITSDFDSLFESIITQFELSDLQEFSEFTLRRSENDGLAVLIVDNAHHLTDAVLIELIDLIKSGDESRVHLVLFAEPHLLPRLEHLDAPDVVLSDFQLEKLSVAESVDYLNFRMEMADYLGPEIFTEPKVEVWWRQSRGQLQRLHEYAQEALLVSVSAQGSYGLPKKSSHIVYIVGASMAGAALLMGYMYWGGRTATVPSPKVSEQISVAVVSSLAKSSTSNLSQEPALLHEGVNSVQVLGADLSEKVIDSEVVSSAIQIESSVGQNTSLSARENVQDENIAKQKIVSSESPLGVQSGAVAKSEKTNSVVKEIKKVDVPQTTKKVFAKVDELHLGKTKNISNRRDYSEQEKTILSWRESDFTLQVMGLSSENAVRSYIAEQQNKKDLLVFKSLRKGKDWFVVVTGRYSSSASARQAAQLLPESQRKAVPWPRDLKTIQNEIRSR